MTRARFFNVPLEPHTTSEGVVDLPILYYDATNVVAVFTPDATRAASLLKHTGLEPVLVRGRAIVALSFFEYRASSVGPYNEVGTAILAKRVGTKTRWSTSAAYVVDLPVTTPKANAAGRELWGYPKFVTPIAFDFRGRRFSASVSDPAGGEPIVSIAGRMGRALPLPPISFKTFTLFQRTLLRTRIDVRGRCALHRPGDVAFHIGESEHRMTKNLHALGLGSARPAALITTRGFAARLHAGVAV